MKSLRIQSPGICVQTTEWFCSGEQSYKISDPLFGSPGLSLTQLSQTVIKRSGALAWGFLEHMETVSRQGSLCWEWARQMLGDGRSSPVLAAAPCSVHNQAQALAKNAAQVATWAGSECCFKWQKSCTARHFLQHLCRDGMTLTLLSWRPNKINLSSPVDCVLWEKVMERKVCDL